MWSLYTCGHAAMWPCGSRSQLPPSGPRSHVDHAAIPCTPAVTALASFAVRRASDVAQFLTTDVNVDIDFPLVHVKVVPQDNDQASVGQLAYLAAVSAQGGGPFGPH